MSSNTSARPFSFSGPENANLEQYKKQAKDMVKLRRSETTNTRDLERLFKLIQQFHPKHRRHSLSEIREARFALSDAQLVLARQHGLESWPKFARAIETAGAKTALENPAERFMRAACSLPQISHGQGTLDEAEALLKANPEIARSSLYTAAVLGNVTDVRQLLAAAEDPSELALRKGGANNWDALTYLCFSRYLRLAPKGSARAGEFVETARVLLDAGALADTGWFEQNNELMPFWESAIYGAAAVADNAELTQLLLDHGADPNDEETAYHAAESYDPAVLRVLLGSGKLNEWSMTTLLLRKGDVHDAEGMRLVLEARANPNAATQWRRTPVQHTLLRDNQIANIALLLDHWPRVETEAGLRLAAENVNDGESMAWIAARRGRGDVLRLLEERGFPVKMEGVRALVAACALGDGDAAGRIAAERPELLNELREKGGNLLSDFAGNGNVEGLRLLLDLGLDVTMTTRRGDSYFDVARDGTALHSATWRMRHDAVALLLERGVPVNALDAKGRSALQRAVTACVDSYWKQSRKPDSVEMLLKAGASVVGIEFPCGYAEVDGLLREYGARDDS